MQLYIRTIVFAVLCLLSLSARAIDEHVTFSASLVTEPDTAVVIHADMEEGWHIYGLVMPESDDWGVPDPTTVELTGEGVAAVDMPQAEPASAIVSHFDSDLNLDIPWLTGSFDIIQKVSLAAADTPVTGKLRYMACNDITCTAPATFEFTIGDASAATASAEAASGDVAVSSGSPFASADSQLWWQPVEVETSTSEQSYWMILLLGFLGGLLALMTPCIWPMIPMTVSFFLKRSKDSRAKAIRDALTYALSIIVIFVSLGILLTLIFGPGELNRIATGAVFNLIFFAILVVFAISFFGAFEIRLPQKWADAADSKANGATGIMSIFFMAFTLVLVSFSCTGPIIGTLLVETFSQSNIMGPLLGMGGFALGLALPFGLFAFFPSMLKELPKSGSWLNSVKVILGFIELILSLKFLSVADLAYGWHILDREVFISIWIVLFILLGLYMLGKLRFPHDGEPGHTSVAGFFGATISLAFAVYLVPGLWGAPLKAVSAFAPPLYTQDFNLYGGEFHEYNNYDRGMEAARDAGKPVLVDFSGYACVNCRKMEGAVFDTPTVRGLIENDYIMIKLMVDDKASLDQPLNVTEQGRDVTLETVGDLWSYLQRHKFGTNQQPYYVILDNEGRPLGAPRAHDENVGAFVGWLEEGITAYQNQ